MYTTLSQSNNGSFFYSEWAAERKVAKKLHELSTEELDETLRLFYAEVRNRDGADYSKSTLLCFRNGIERYLNGPPHNKGIQISSSPAFKKSNLMLDAKIKKIKTTRERKHSTQTSHCHSRSSETESVHHTESILPHWFPEKCLVSCIHLLVPKGTRRAKESDSFQLQV